MQSADSERTGPCWLIAEHVKAGRLDKVMEDASYIAIDMHLAWPAMRHMPHRIRVVIDVLAQALPPLLSVGAKPARGAAA